MDLVGYVYSLVYRALPMPHVRITGLRPASEALFEGETFPVTAEWWNRFLDKRPAVHRRGAMRHLQPEDVQRLSAAVNPQNRPWFDAMGAEYSPYSPRLGAAALTLAYALARTLLAGNPWLSEEDAEIVYGRAEPIDPHTFEHYGKRYTFAADYEMWEQSPGWWAEQEQGWVVNRLLIAGMRWAYNDQIRRWEKGEGRKLGEGIGWSIEEGELLTNFGDRLFELGGRLLEAEIVTIV